MWERFKKDISKVNELYIYGAGTIAYGAQVALRSCFNVEVLAHLVTDRANNPDKLGDVCVCRLTDVELEQGAGVLIATPVIYHEEIAEILAEAGLERDRIHFLTEDVEYFLMGEYLHKECGIATVEDYRGDETLAERHGLAAWESKDLDAYIAMAYSANDKKLKGSYSDAPWVHKCDVLRIDGDNVADKNSLLGELCATYYMWKNESHDVMGLFHYRRTLEVDECDLNKLVDGVYDVILPLPFVCYPDTSGQYGRYLNDDDVNIMREVLSEFHPEFAKKAEQILANRYLYNYNMLIASREAFCHYCEFIFPLLKEISRRCEGDGVDGTADHETGAATRNAAVSETAKNREVVSKLSGEKRDRLPRYIARIGELLTSLYFQVNEDDLKVVHAKKEWRV